jgi:hypothetical protein
MDAKQSHKVVRASQKTSHILPHAVIWFGFVLLSHTDAGLYTHCRAIQLVNNYPLRLKIILIFLQCALVHIRLGAGGNFSIHKRETDPAAKVSDPSRQAQLTPAQPDNLKMYR